MPPNWKPEEVAAACKAYVAATLDCVHGADQKVEDFNDSILHRLKELTPKEAPEGTYWMRGIRVYKYLRDNVFSDVQKFNKSLMLVERSKPSGVTEQQKINMAVAIHEEEVDWMDYEYIQYNASKWRFYLGYLQLKHLPKFSMSYNGRQLEEDGEEQMQDSTTDTEQQEYISPSSDSGDSDSQGNKETPPGQEKTSHKENVNGNSNNTRPYSKALPSIPSAVSSRAKGNRKGVKAAKREAARVALLADKEEKRRKRDHERSAKLSSIADNIAKIRATMDTKTDFGILTKMLKRTNNGAALNEKLEDQLLSLVNKRFNQETVAAPTPSTTNDNVESMDTSNDNTIDV